MGHALAQVRLNRNGGLPEDSVVNTFHFDTGAGAVDLADAQAIQVLLKDFYDTAPPGGSNPLRAFLSNLISRVDHQTKVYDMDAPEPRAPVATFTWSFSAELGTTLPMPAEVAICLSFRAELVSGTNPARRRGRIFVGPLKSTTVVNSGPDLRPDSSTRTDIARSGAAMIEPASGPIWSVWSPTDTALWHVRSCSVDDAFDTQRRRGVKATSRVILPAP